MLESTLVILKPDCIKRGLVGEVLRRLEISGLRISKAKQIVPSKSKLYKHYSHLPNEIIDNILVYFQQDIMIAFVVSGESAISKVRKLIGATDPLQALPGTIRGDFGCDNMQQSIMDNRAVQNIIHASDDRLAFEKEYKLWFME